MNLPIVSNMTSSTPLSSPPRQQDNQEPVIILDNVSVHYRVAQERIPSFKEYAIRWMQGRVKTNSLWALKNITLDIRRGEVFGLIGQNGAGKSTLLKVVARVLRPTRGRVRLYGRVAPLLELGAGFDSELTGRENIYLNGALLGMTREEIEERMESMIEFAGLKEFIDAPLRTYSTGMFARLGFSIATAKRPEILIVDEILGVGDAEFQTKSYERIQSFQAAGTTILLVSHSMERVEEICTRAAWLDHGELVSLGTAKAVVNQYLRRTIEREAARMAAEREAIRTATGAPGASGEAEQPDGDSPVPSNITFDDGMKSSASADLDKEQAAPTRWGTRKVEITRVRITDQAGQEQTIFETGQALVLHMDYKAHQPVSAPIFGLAIHRQDGVHITGPNTSTAGVTLPALREIGSITYTIPSLPLLDGLYNFSVAVVNDGDTEIFDYHDRLYPFRVINRDEINQERYGLLTLRGEWRSDDPYPLETA